MRHPQYTAIMCLALAAGGITGCSGESSTIAATPTQEAAVTSSTPVATQAVPTELPSATTQPTSSPEMPTGTVPMIETATTTATATAQSTLLPTSRPSAAADHRASRTPIQPTPGEGSNADQVKVAAVQRARADLAGRLGIDANTIELLSITRRFKPTGVSDSPGRLIGWDIRLAVGDQAYRYQVDTNGVVRRR